MRLSEETEVDRQVDIAVVEGGEKLEIGTAKTTVFRLRPPTVGTAENSHTSGKADLEMWSALIPRMAAPAVRR